MHPAQMLRNRQALQIFRFKLVEDARCVAIEWVQVLRETHTFVKRG
jgi:hypothetical protein